MRFFGIYLRAITQSAQTTVQYNECENYIFEITATPRRGEWIKYNVRGYVKRCIGNEHRKLQSLVNFGKHELKL